MAKSCAEKISLVVTSWTPGFSLCACIFNLWFLTWLFEDTTSSTQLHNNHSSQPRAVIAILLVKCITGSAAINWEGHHSKTGQQYQPSCTTKGGISSGLVKKWEKVMVSPTVDPKIVLENDPESNCFNNEEPFSQTVSLQVLPQIQSNFVKAHKKGQKKLPTKSKLGQRSHVAMKENKVDDFMWVAATCTKPGKCPRSKTPADKSSNGGDNSGLPIPTKKHCLTKVKAKKNIALSERDQCNHTPLHLGALLIAISDIWWLQAPAPHARYVQGIREREKEWPQTLHSRIYWLMMIARPPAIPICCQQCLQPMRFGPHNLLHHNPCLCPHQSNPECAEDLNNMPGLVPIVKEPCHVVFGDDWLHINLHLWVVIDSSLNILYI
ncbi:hypothetical protein DFH09DRAFT_1097831 [Mycena vulgaris]|nr:hypothetical protein DFH09DRAFT_1097831 [Mycena vulgaris]